MQPYEPIPEEKDRVASAIVDAALKVHRALGPGLLEGVYESCLCHEVSRRRIPFQRQLEMPIVYEGLRLESGLRIDLIVDQKVIVEIKAVEALIPIFKSQLLTYLKLSHIRLGLLINFNERLVKDGIQRVAL